MREDLNCLPAFDLKLSSFMSYNTTFSEKVGRILINTLFCHHHFKDRLASVGIPQKHISWHPSHVCKTHCGRGTWSWEGVQQKWEESKKLVGPMFHWQKIDLLWPGSCFPSLCGAVELLQRACRLLTNDFNLFSAANQSL